MTDIVISIDLEFDINRAFAGDGSLPVGVDSIRSQAHPGLGLDAILDPLEANGLRAVFFTEAANTHYFGFDEMGAVTRELRERGHDLQLHLHPVWRLFAEADWRERCRERPPRPDREDNFGALTAAERDAALAHGLRAFAEWGLPRPRAFRTGNLMISRDGYRSLAAHGFELSSSLGLRGFEGETAMPAALRTIDEFDGVLEVPVTRYEEVSLGKLQRSRLFSLTGCSRTALRHVPQLAHEQGVSPLMLLTHAAEFMPAATSAGIARVNADKFRRWCDYLAAHRDRYSVVTVAESIERWRADKDNQNERLQFPLLRGLQSVVDRVIELKINAA